MIRVLAYRAAFELYLFAFIAAGAVQRFLAPPALPERDQQQSRYMDPEVLRRLAEAGVIDHHHSSAGAA